jgi:pimeloyl-ACP methyl ester carboxylesterase
MMTPPGAAAPLAEAVRTRLRSIGLHDPEWVRIPDCGHAMMAEKPADVRMTLDGFLSRHPMPRSAD